MASILNVDQIRNAAGTSSAEIKSDGTFYPAGGVVQVVSTTPDLAQVNITNTSYVSAGLSLSITPKSTSSKILIFCNFTASTNNGRAHRMTMYRGATNLAPDDGLARVYTASGGDCWHTVGINFLDSPSTASSVTYTLYHKSEGGSSVSLYASSAVAPTLTLMEIAG